MSNIVDLNKEREIKVLIDKLGSLISTDSNLQNRTVQYLNEELKTMDTDKTRTVSVRFPIELLEWIDSYSRIAAVNQSMRVTRNMTVIGFLETMRGIIERQEKTVWGCSHQEMIQRAMNATTTSNATGGE